jgi:hypothetical protein
MVYIRGLVYTRVWGLHQGLELTLGFRVYSRVYIRS